MIVIDRNIPVTEVPRQRSEAKYPFAGMQVGDSFLFRVMTRVNIPRPAIVWLISYVLCLGSTASVWVGSL